MKNRLIIIALLIGFACKKDIDDDAVPSGMRSSDQAKADALALTGLVMECYGGPVVNKDHGGCSEHEFTRSPTTCKGNDKVVSCPAEQRDPCRIVSFDPEAR